MIKEPYIKQHSLWMWYTTSEPQLYAAVVERPVPVVAQSEA
jgi:hypothetical protein